MTSLPDIVIKKGEWFYSVSDAVWTKAYADLTRGHSSFLTEQEARKLGIEPEKELLQSVFVNYYRPEIGAVSIVAHPTRSMAIANALSSDVVFEAVEYVLVPKP